MPAFNFASFSEFLAMGNYGLYVWLSFGFTLLLLLALVVISQRQQRSFIQQLVKNLAREARVKAHQQQESV